MQINEVIKWYEEHTDSQLNEYFLKRMIEIGIIKTDIDLSYLNLYLLERFNDGFVVENGKYRVKKNRLPLISQTMPTEQPIKKENNDKVEQMKKAVEKLEDKPKRFKIEKLNGNRLKLVKQ